MPRSPAPSENAGAEASPHFVLTAITKDQGLAARADAAGVDRVGIDIERQNKSARQGHLPQARLSNHRLADLANLAPVLRRAALFARLNPLHDGSADEVATALAGGAGVLMLPFFTTVAEVERFVLLVDGRARIVLLLETAAALVRLHDILAVAGIDEVMVGLNDLHLSTGIANPFELVASDVMTLVSQQVRGRGLGFGFGGVARAGDDTLPVPADLVLAQHARLRSSAAWLSRSFFAGLPETDDLGSEIGKLRRRLAYWFAQPEAALERERDRLRVLLAGLGAGPTGR
jgi:HpcH/HpaI aldolase/citrate lyase family